MTQLTLKNRTHEVSGSALLPILTVEKQKKSAPIIIQSRRTGKDYTFKISRSEYQEKWYTHIWIEQTYNHYAHMGTYWRGHNSKGSIIKDGRRLTSQGAKAIVWVLDHAIHKRFSSLQKQVAILHTGRCLACGRELTDAESVKRGVGPVCAGQR